MSRVGRRPVDVPEAVKVGILSEGRCRRVVAEGPKGKMSVEIPADIEVKLLEEDNKRCITVLRADDKKRVKALHGTIRQSIYNMIIGITQGFEKQLICEGIGYNVSIQGSALKLEVGYSHPVIFTPPEGITIEVREKNIIVVKGIDKYLVGEVAAKIKRIRPADPYKLKGIRYKDEYIMRKAGKSVVATK